MAAEEELCHSLQVISKTAHTNEHVMSQAPLPAVSMDHNAEAAAAAAALDHNAGRAATASDCTSQWQSATSMPIIAMPDHINSSQIPTNDADHSNLVAALQYDHPEQISSIAIALISPSKKIHARCSSSGKEEEEEEEVGSAHGCGSQIFSLSED